VRARARRVPCSVHPMERPPATTTSAPRPPTGLRAATARGTTTPAFCCFVLDDDNGTIERSARRTRVSCRESQGADEG
jgi:hypothetical protein